jgi:serine protease Do
MARTRTFRTFFAGAGAAIVAVALSFGVQPLVGGSNVERALETPAAHAQEAPVAAPEMGLPNVSSIFDAQKSKVVAISTEMAANPREGMFPFFRGPIGPRMGQGSGFIVDPDGYVITNYHVVKGASRITVAFENDEKFDATLVGSDEKIDIALLKIDAGKKLPAVELGSSERLRVGQWVVAIGNPFGLDYSVTAGIISAKGRNIGAGPYDDFIQTDASINPGNSGGPLFDLAGRVIGVNTAIIRDGQGIGFAVPIDMVKAVVPQLKNKGYVSRGYMGAGIQDLEGDLAESFGVKEGEGVLIGSVEPGGPADKAGLEPGDIVTEFDGKRVTSVQELLVAVAQVEPGKRTTAVVKRRGKTQRLGLTVAERPDTRRPEVAPAQARPKVGDSKLGVAVRPVDSRVASQVGLEAARGVLVEEVMRGAPAAQILRAGDVILSVDGIAVNTPAELRAALSKSRKIVRLQVFREGSSIFVATKL